MAGNQESNVRKQQETAPTQEKSPVDQISPEKVPNMNTESIDSTKQLLEVQRGTGNVADTALDLIAQLLSERLKMVETHREEYLEAVNSYVALANASLTSNK
ncbi:unnamed protein product [Anisakis simplex]|uniref:MIT domain-containing protein n=1 Tax=Anisakis simplex TaxID=6269 RepID=A0A0M3K8J1_ANISI|nr:unnamed protein product [Anisakis simplex]